MRRYIAFFCLIFMSISWGMAQTSIHQWTTHAPGMKVINVEKVNEKIYAATPYELYYYNTNDNSINKLTKVNGLSDFGISIMRYNPHTDYIFIGYSNTNIDLIDRNGKVVNISDIKNKDILADKTINDVYFIDELAYVCCGFGIVVIDMNRMEVKDTYIIGDNGAYLNVNDITLYDNKLYAATSHGVYYADYSSSNLADFSFWTKDLSMIHSDINYSEIECFNGNLLANYSENKYGRDTLFVYNGTTWDYHKKDTHAIRREIKGYDDRLILVEQYSVKIVDTNDNFISNFDSSLEPFDAIYDKTRNIYWIGDKYNSLIKMNLNNTCEYIRFNGPYSTNNFYITAHGNQLWVASGGFSLTWAKRWLTDGVSYYTDYEWNYINSRNNEAFDTITDFVCVAIDKTNSSKVYVGSYHEGLLEFDNYKLTKIHDETNSTLGKLIGYDYVYVTGLDFDSKNNLWVANHGAEKRLSVKTTNNSWHSFNISNDKDISRLYIDRNDYKWILRRDGSFLVYNDNNTVTNASDDEYKIISTKAGQGGLPKEANCMDVDSNGTVWVGTNDGIALFYSPSKIFQSGVNYDASRILVPRNDGSGQADYLLSGESVTAIAIDDADNLWVGTHNGVFYISNNGLTEYHHFTEDNSPLLSNKIQDIAIDGDGNVFFATDKGIISFRGKATEGQSSNSDVFVYPNPVRAGYTGLVGIKNLVPNSLVKITGVDGSFITHLYSEGGQAVWDCTNIKGNKVEPGIYLIFISDETGKENFATKILIQ